MLPRVYIETSVISYLTSLPSRDIVQLAHQQLTHEWWSRRDRFELFVSRVVVAEASRGDAAAAKRRLTSLEGIAVLETGADADSLATHLIDACALPAKAAIDALHIAVAVANGMDYLLTWNCTHIANAFMRNKIETACREFGFQPVTICTPEELSE
jgi:hypothetical protein